MARAKRGRQKGKVPTTRPRSIAAPASCKYLQKVTIRTKIKRMAKLKERCVANGRRNEEFVREDRSDSQGKETIRKSVKERKRT